MLCGIICLFLSLFNRSLISKASDYSNHFKEDSKSIVVINLIKDRCSLMSDFKKESDYFLECLVHPQREAMIHIFFGERAASKISDIPKDTTLHQIKTAGVIGSGTMGGGIAMNFANAGIPVLVLDQDEKNLNHGIQVIEKNLEAFDSLEKNSLDLYASVKSLYLQDRERKIKNIDETTETMNDDDWEELESE